MGIFGTIGGGLAGGAFLGGPVGMVGGGLLGNATQNGLQNGGGPLEGAGQMLGPLDIFGWDKSGERANAALGNQFMANSPRPRNIQYQNSYTPGMQMEGQFNPNTQGLNAFRTEALRTGPSRGAQLQMGQQNLMQTQGRNQAARDVAGATAGSRSQLAMRGGLTGGASERLAKQGKKDLFNMQQNLQAQKMGNAATIGIADEQSRMGQLAQLPGMENQALQPGMQSKMFDVTNQMKNNMGRNAFDMQQYEAQMKAFENAQQANAMLNSGKKGGFLGGLFG